MSKALMSYGYLRQIALFHFSEYLYFYLRCAFAQ